MGNPVLNFDSERQIFEFDEEIIAGMDFRQLALAQLFNKKKSYVLIKNFIDKRVAGKIRDYYSKTETSKSFVQLTKDSNFRMFYYLNSPFKYPNFIESLLKKCMIFKNKLYECQEYYQTYCMLKKVNPKNHEEVARIQNLHSWSSIFWYKDGNSHFKHIDSYGELACFLVLSQKGNDYDSGGLKVYGEDQVECVDDLVEYGDLLFLDQSEVFHEVSTVKTSGDQIGRLNIYIPTIPPNYMNRVLTYEGHPFRVYITDEDVSFTEMMGCWLQNILKRDGVHYSRIGFKHFLERL